MSCRQGRVVSAQHMHSVKFGAFDNTGDLGICESLSDTTDKGFSYTDHDVELGEEVAVPV